MGSSRTRRGNPGIPLKERYGLIFAYMGPPERKPILPLYECLEVLDEGEFVEADDYSIGGGGPVIVPCNWLQHYENVADPFHVRYCTASFSGPQFTTVDGVDAECYLRSLPRGRPCPIPLARWTTEDILSRHGGVAADPAGGAESASRPNSAVSNRSAGFCRSTTCRFASTSPVASKIFRRHRSHAIEVQRQGLGGNVRGGAPAITLATTKRK